MKTLRLLVTKECNKNCEGCCNKDWDLDNLPVVEHFNYDEIILTGGEPLNGKVIHKTIVLGRFLQIIDVNLNRRVYVYTSYALGVHWYWDLFDGFTLTIHNQEDVIPFIAVNKMLLERMDKTKSLRLNIFSNIELPKDIDLSLWKVKENIEWIKNCPLPENEVFMRLKNI